MMRVAQDNYSLWKRYERLKEEWLKSRPICCRCQDHIQDEPMYHPETGVAMCPDCYEELMEEDEE